MRIARIYPLAALAAAMALAAAVVPGPAAAAPKSASRHHPRGMNPCGGKGPIRFAVDDPMGRNVVTFKSEAPLEDIVGTSNAVSGWIEFDPMHPERGARGELTVPVSSLKTGIPLRDEHLQGRDWLDAARHPSIRFTIDGVRNVKSLKSSREFKTYSMDVTGKLTVRGRTKRVSFPARVTYLPESEKTRQKMPGDLLAGRGEFTVRLADFGVTGPAGADLIGTKVGQEISIGVSLVASNAASGAAMNPCGGKSGMNPCGGKSGMNPCGGKSEMNPCGGKSGMNPCGGKSGMNPCGGKS
ncbi:MAG: hypothetical protein D6718_09515 [Acidobacteria bacterium]|nr:MAG: hypothetical protein D6718_09515 [Acidobacteriota bacterium]